MESIEKLTGRGGAGRGQGRKKGKTKVSIQVTLDAELIDWVDGLGGKRASQINQIIKTHKARIENMIRESDDLQERFDL